jgi:hypothetical protein
LLAGGTHPSTEILGTYLVNGASSEIFSNGTSVLSGDAGNTANTIEYVFGRPADAFGGTAKELIIYNSDQSDKRRAIEENIANHYGISLAAFSRDGTVSTWYDQSENSGVPNANHATQTDPTKQPDIVVNGNLVTGGINFDGANDYFDLTSTITQSGELSYFFALDGLVSSPNTLIGTSSGASPRVRCESSNLEIKSSTTENNYSTSAWTANSGKSLVSFNRNAANLTSAYRDGAEIGTAATIPDNFNHNRLFKLDDANASNFNGKCQEVIIYNTDQSANRTAIEANIGETYGITAIPAADDTVNGFVQTWYDQSGSVPANDAEQSAASSQPKIVGEVTSGQPHAFLGAIEFDGSQQFQTITLTSSAQPNSIFSVSNTNVAGQNRGIYGTNANQASYYRSSNEHAIYSSGNGAAVLKGSAYLVDTDYLRFDLFNGANSVVGVNGTTTSGTSGDAVLNRLDIGDASLSGADPLNGGIKELILYTDDQSSNRPAIEANIANQYGITLS